MNQCIFLAGFHRRKILLLQNIRPRFRKTCSPAVSSCVKTHLGYMELYNSIRKSVTGVCSVSVDSHNCYPDKMKLYCQMTSQQEVPSKQFLSKNSKTQNLTKVLAVMENQSGCFSDSFEAATLQLSQGDNIALPSGPNFQVHRHFLAVSKLGKQHLEHTVPFHEKRGQGRVFCKC